MTDETTISPNLLFSIMCDDVRREQNGKYILIGLFETIGSKSFPAIHPGLFIINCWIGGLGTFKQKSRIVTISGKALIEDRETSFILRTLKSKHRVIARFNNLKFDTPGEYSVEILLNGELKIRYPLTIRQITPSTLKTE